MATRYFIRLPDPTQARGKDAELAFSAHGADAFGGQLQTALRADSLYQRWKAKQAAPADDDDNDEAEREDPLAAVDGSATVVGEQSGLAIDLVVTTSLAGSVLKHRLRILAGSHWELRDVRGA